MKMKTSRRRFLLLSAGVGSSLALSRAAFAAAAANTVNETDPQAQAVGYVADASKVDKAKFPNFAAGQACASCSLFQGKASDTYGGCTLFGDKQVASRGWCSAYSNI
jgi:hypothetical protein